MLRRYSCRALRRRNSVRHRFRRKIGPVSLTDRTFEIIEQLPEDETKCEYQVDQESEESLTETGREEREATGTLATSTVLLGVNGVMKSCYIMQRIINISNKYFSPHTH